MNRYTLDMQRFPATMTPDTDGEWCRVADVHAQPVADERKAFEAWLGVKPSGQAMAFAWDAWQARAVLAANKQENK